jgi:DNA-binding HxlR family transcriptional regulator
MADAKQPRKSYGQFCGLARALDRIGDRWMLLIVRELLPGAVGFAGLRAALPGIASNLLVQRLAELESCGLVRRSPHPARSKSVRYELTEIGKALEPAVLELIRWGAVWMQSGPGDDLVNPRWASLALRALLSNPDINKPAGTLAIEADGEYVTISTGPKGRLVTSGPPGKRVRALIRGPFPAVLAVAAGRMLLAEAEAILVEGDLKFAQAALGGPGERDRSGARRVISRAGRGGNSGAQGPGSPS